LAGLSIAFRFISTGAKKLYSFFKFIILNDIVYIFLLLTVAFVCAFLNFNAKNMSGLIPAYLDFARLFETGLDTDREGLRHLYTFPVWGYGLILWITKSKTLLIVLQQMFTVFTIVFVDRCLRTLGWKDISRMVFRGFTLILFSWYFFHTVLWPYSWGANLLIISLFLLLLHISTGKIRYAIFSGVLYGFMLNFRSDYYFFGIALFLILLILGLSKQIRIRLIPLTIWLILIFVMLIPWGWYSYQKTGEILLKSSNGGHVLFISLGQLPDNKWGITPLDKDPKMREIVNQQVSIGARTLGHEADKVLTATWLDYIRDDKGEFIKKVKHNFCEIIDYPFYNGEMMKTSQGYAARLIKNTVDEGIQAKADSIPGDPFLKEKLEIFKVFLWDFGREMLYWFLWALIVVLIFLKHRIFKDEFLIIFLALLGYQWSLMTLAYFMRVYHTNILPVYVLLIVYCLIEVNPVGKFYSAFSRYSSKKRTAWGCPISLLIRG